MLSVPGSGAMVAGRYRLHDQLGRGAMGIVWRGRDELLDRDVAVKQIVLPAMASETDAQATYQRTLREARSAARLSHSGVITIFDVVEEDGSPWIVMELIRARPLDQVIAEDGPLPPAQAAQLGLSLLDALASAHAAGVLHRDVKPSNVLISPDGKAVLTDFGIATIAGDPDLTQAGMVFGTPGFSPPERIRGSAASPASDLWSLGATLYAAVEGRGPFDRAGGSLAIVASIATEPAPRAPSAGPLGPVIDALLRADPAERPDEAAAARMLTEALGAASGQLQPSWAHQPAAASAADPVQAGLPQPPPAEPASMSATTATQLVGVPMPGDLAGAAQAGAPGLVAAGNGQPANTGPVANAAGPAVNAAGPVVDAGGAASATQVVPDLMATPNFADLQMPPSPSGPPGSASAGPAPQTALTAARPAPAVTGTPGSVAEARGRRNRRALLLAPIAVSAVVIGVVFLAFPSARDSLLRGLHLPGISRVGPGGSGLNGQAGGSGHHRSAAGKNGSAGQPGQGTPGSSAGGSHGAGKPSPSGHPSSGGPSTTPSPSPSPSPSASPAALPPGYAWQSVSAATAGTTAGFRLAAPATWLLTAGLDSYLQPPNGGARLGVDMGPFAYPWPVKEARYLQATAIATGKYHDYHLISIIAMRYRGVAAATWTFWWRPRSALYRIDVTEVIFTAKMSAGPQPYIVSMGVPAPHASWAARVMRVALRTFTPLP